MDIVVGGFQRRAGRELEDAIAGTLRLALKRDIKPENITMRKKIKARASGAICNNREIP